MEGLAVNRWLVTGHTGFKGAWLTLYLQRLGVDVYGFSIDESPLFTQVVATRMSRGRDLRGDVREPRRLLAAMRRAKPEVVVHLAAESIVRRAAEFPRRTWETNVLGTLRLLEAVRQAPSVRAVIVVTSDKCYRNDGRGRAFRETDPLGGDDPYSASKAAAEHVVASYRATYFSTDSAVSVATARAGNVVGSGDTAIDRLIPDCLRALDAGRPIGLRNPESTRPWQHVLDVVRGYVMLAEAQLRDPAGHAGAFNFGPPARPTLTVREVAELVIAARGRGSWKHLAGSSPVREAACLRLDSSKARRQLGWRPRIAPAEAITRAASRRDPIAELTEYLAS